MQGDMFSKAVFVFSGYSQLQCAARLQVYIPDTDIKDLKGAIFLRIYQRSLCNTNQYRDGKPGAPLSRLNSLNPGTNHETCSHHDKARRHLSTGNQVLLIAQVGPSEPTHATGKHKSCLVSKHEHKSCDLASKAPWALPVCGRFIPLCCANLTSWRELGIVRNSLPKASPRLLIEEYEGDRAETAREWKSFMAHVQSLRFLASWSQPSSTARIDSVRIK